MKLHRTTHVARQSLRIVFMARDIELRLVSLVVRGREGADEVVLMDLGSNDSTVEYAEEIGMNISGYTNQTYFLFGCGLENLVPDMNLLDIKSQTKVSQELRTLTMPDEMGERFKFIALTKKYNKKLLGFSKMNQRSQL